AGPEPADVRRSVEEERAGQVDRRLGALVEDADLRPVADADHVPLDDDLVARAQLEDLALVDDREGELVRRHQASLLPRAAAVADVARRAESTRAPPPRVGPQPSALGADAIAPTAAGPCQLRKSSSTAVREGQVR